MATRARSFSKVNLGLAIGPVREDGFHGLATLYQTLALFDGVTVAARRVGTGHTRISITTNHPFVPRDDRNTAWKMVEGCLARLGVAAEVAIDIKKNLPVQGGMGAGSANAAAALLGLERELGVRLADGERMELAAGVGSDVPLFLVGGAVLGTGRGEKVRGVRDFGATACVVVAPGVGVSTPKAFRDWDALTAGMGSGGGLTSGSNPGRVEELSRAYASVLSESETGSGEIGSVEPGTSGIVHGLHPEKKLDGSELDGISSVQSGSVSDLAENTLLALVRTGIENDFEQVVFPEYPSLREIKRLLLGIDSGSPALYAALSGSGSALFGLYRSRQDAELAQQRVQASAIAGGSTVMLTETLPRQAYWRRMFAE